MHNYDIFLAKIYDYLLTNSFWGSAGIIDSPISYATLATTIMSQCSYNHGPTWLKEHGLIDSQGVFQRYGWLGMRSGFVSRPWSGMSPPLLFLWELNLITNVISQPFFELIQVETKYLNTSWIEFEQLTDVMMLLSISECVGNYINWYFLCYNGLLLLLASGNLLSERHSRGCLLTRPWMKNDCQGNITNVTITIMMDTWARSANIRPVTGPSLKPIPEKPTPKTTLGWSGRLSMTGFWSGVIV